MVHTLLERHLGPVGIEHFDFTMVVMMFFVFRGVIAEGVFAFFDGWRDGFTVGVCSMVGVDTYMTQDGRGWS